MDLVGAAKDARHQTNSDYPMNWIEKCEWKSKGFKKHKQEIQMNAKTTFHDC